jgi:23S rRNA pseudouridine1911/1915/1917 synthase
MCADDPRSARFTTTDADSGKRLDQVIARRLPDLSRSQIQRLIRSGHITLSEGQAKPALAVWSGLDVDVRVPAASPAVPGAEALPLSLLYDDKDIAVVNKPSGMVVHPGAGHATGTLVNALLHHLGDLSGIGGAERPGIVHRLDRDTSGVMVIAKHDRAHRALSRQFQDREVRKEYLALVWGTAKAGDRVARPIGRDPRHRQKMSSRAPRARPAVSRVLEVEPLGGVSLARIAIDTGRTNQIRVHLSETGHPVVGDALYGGARKSVPPRLAALSKLRRPFLHAALLGFSHPTHGGALVFEAPLPADLAGVLEALRRASGRHLQVLD